MLKLMLHIVGWQTQHNNSKNISLLLAVATKNPQSSRLTAKVVLARAAA